MNGIGLRTPPKHTAGIDHDISQRFHLRVCRSQATRCVVSISRVLSGRLSGDHSSRVQKRVCLLSLLPDVKIVTLLRSLSLR